MPRPMKQLSFDAPFWKYAVELRAAMHARKIGPKALADLVGIGPTSMSYFVSGMRLPTPHYQGKIAEALGVHDDRLFFPGTFRRRVSMTGEFFS